MKNFLKSFDNNGTSLADRSLAKVSYGDSFAS